MASVRAVADRAAGVAAADARSASAVPRWWDRPAAIVGGLTLIVAVLPLAVALGVLRHPRWYPLLDLAQTELRVRDVGTGNPPLVGLAGRFNAYDQQGSHLGPISFWSLWPFYKIFGSSAWALQAAAACLSTVAAGVVIWIGQRRGGVRLALALAAGLVVLMRVYGADKLTEAWNPYLPMLWWMVFLLAVWSVLCDDLPLLPVATFAGTFAMQTHVPYMGLVGGVAGLLVLGGVVWLVLRQAEGDLRRRVVRWGGASLALLVVLWIPPVVEQLTGDPGNMSIMWKSLANPEEDVVQPGEAASVWLAHMNLGELVVPQETGMEASDNAWPGVGLLGVWLASAAVTGWMWRRDRQRHDPRLVRLHLVVAAALALGLVSITRITGLLWYYLVLWAWGTTVLLLVAVVWTAVALSRGSKARLPGGGEDGDGAGDRDWDPAEDDGSVDGARDDGGVARDDVAVARRRSLVGVGTLGALLVVATAAFTYDAAHTDVPASTETALLARLAPPTVEALRDGDLPGGGEDGRYLVLWDNDALGIGSQGYGMLLELERQGFDVGASRRHQTGVVEHRVLDPADATAAVHYVVGEEVIELWKATPGATLVDEADVRTPEERQRFDQVHDELAADLEAAGHADLLPLLDRTLFLLGIHEDMPPNLLPAVDELMALGVPAAVFVTPPDVTQPAPG